MDHIKGSVVKTSAWAIFVAVTCSAYAADSVDSSRGDRMIAAYFQNETRKLAEACLADIETLEDWTKRREVYRQQLHEMLGLDPLPERTPLRAVITGSVEHEEFVVEKLHFQSRPRLYVTANLYLPKGASTPVPAVLYVCGHGPAKKDGISYGNKTKYQHHAAWFARNGYACLVLDTVQLGEIEGVHHGTYRENMWWWNARGYTPAGVEAWNSIRGLDYLESRPEVDSDRMGVTGRSGGGAYSWWLAALDDRVRVAVPVAGITNLENHVVDGCVEGHCDCMYLVNTYRWDYAQVAALVAPRPLLISNTDRDDIFPLDGVIDVHSKVRRLYQLHGKPERIGLHIAAGRHDDTQPLQVHAFQWFNQHLKDQNPPIDMVAESFFSPEELKVFDKLPEDEINTRIHETFTPDAPTPPVPQTDTEWRSLAANWRRELREQCFRGWPEEPQERGQAMQVSRVFEARAGNVQFRAYDFGSQDEITLRLYLVTPANVPPAELERVVLHPLDAAGWSEFLAAMQVDFASELAGESLPEPSPEHYQRLRKELLSGKHGLAYVAPRGIGPSAWDADSETHIRRRFMLLGQTLDSMRVWDVRRAIQALRTIEGLSDTPMWLDAEQNMAGLALYAALFEPRVARLDLHGLSKSHRDGPDFLNVLRILDMPQAAALVAENSPVRIHQAGNDGWKYPLSVAEKLDWENQMAVQADSNGLGAGQ